MPTCLLGLGSNLGDRQATLRAAIAEIDALPNARVLRHSKGYRARPVGGPAAQNEFLNAAVVIDTTIQPLSLLEHLQRIERRHGRTPAERWAPRTLDIDLLLYGDEVIETPGLTLPHLRMSFRRFVLEPAVEVAPKMLHPVIGWSVERLLLHLNAANDQCVLLSPSESLRTGVAERLTERFDIGAVDRPAFKTAEQLWPGAYSTWLSLNRARDKTPPVAGKKGALPYAAAAFPKLSVLLDADAASPRAMKTAWSAIVRQPGRGPTLRLQIPDSSTVQMEVFAAVEAVWPDLGPASDNRLE